MTALTRESILALPAGPQLDALVAERFMGFVLKPADPWDPSQDWNIGRRTTRWEAPDGSCYRPYPDPQQSGQCYQPLPSYSHDIAAAWEVLEKLKAAAWEPCLLLGEIQDGVRVELETGIIVEADTAPLAACRAALLTTLEK